MKTMNPDEIKKWLRGKEIRLYDEALETKDNFDKAGLKASGNWMLWWVDILESLAATRKLSKQRRALMEKHQWVWNPHPERGKGQGRYECRECHQEHRMPTAEPLWLAIKEHFFHKPSCLWAQAIHTDGPSGTIEKGE